MTYKTKLQSTYTINQVWYLSNGIHNTVWHCILHVLLIPTNLSLRQREKNWTEKTECKIFFVLWSNSVILTWEFYTTSMSMRTTDSAAQGGLFSRSDIMRNAVAQQSCRYLTPLLTTAGENPIHFQLLYSLTVDLVSKHKGEGIQPNTHTSSFHKTLGFNYLDGSSMRGEAKTTQHDFQELMLT